MQEIEQKRSRLKKMVQLDDKNNVRCECGSNAFEKRVTEQKVWETLAVTQDDGSVLHKAVCVTDVKVQLICSNCHKEAEQPPAGVVISQRPPSMLE